MAEFAADSARSAAASARSAALSADEALFSASFGAALASMAYARRGPSSFVEQYEHGEQFNRELREELGLPLWDLSAYEADWLERNGSSAY